MSLYQQTHNRIRQFITQMRYNRIESLFGVLDIIWAIWLLAPWFHVFETSIAFAKVSFIPEYVWGGLYLFSSLLLLTGVNVQHRLMIRKGLLLSAFLWFVMAVGIMQANYHSPGGPLFFVIAMAIGIVYIQTK